MRKSVPGRMSRLGRTDVSWTGRLLSTPLEFLTYYTYRLLYLLHYLVRTDVLSRTVSVLTHDVDEGTRLDTG